MQPPFAARLAPTAVTSSRLIIFALLALCPAAFAEPSPSADLELVDGLLAAVQPGQTMIKLGDVGVTPAQLQAIRDGLAGSRDPRAVTPPPLTFEWPNGNVYYRFAANVSAPKMQAFRDACAEWAAFANLHFIELAPAAALPANYITVKDIPFGFGGFSSSVGKAPTPTPPATTEQFIEIGSSFWNRGTICHEVGHALGLFHEHQRADRGTYVTIQENNIQAGAGGNFVLINNGANRGDYDFQSVMHYGRNTFSQDQTPPADPSQPHPTKDTIVPKPAYLAFLNSMGAPDDRTLSKLDRAGMAAIYGPPVPQPGVLVTNTKDAGPGSLRTALYYAWDRSTAAPALTTTISFQIPTSDSGYDALTGTFTIRPSYLLVAPGSGTTIDGATQTASIGNTNASGPEIVLNGAQVIATDLFASGLRLRAANCVVKNLVINGFNQQGVEIVGAQATGNLITGCYLGTNAAGTAAVPNGFNGVEISQGAKFNMIGGTAGGAGNVIAGNTLDGLRFFGAGTDSNVAQGNLIGLNAAGTTAVGNQLAGVRFFGGAKSNVIGGTSAAARNVISGNVAQGVIFQEAGTSNNAVLGNFIGLNSAGTDAVGNGFGAPPNHYVSSGVGLYSGASANVIGGAAAGAGNVISGNAAQGVAIGEAGTNSNRVEGNLIGLNAAGTDAVANGNGAPPAKFAGVNIFGGAQATVIGGTIAGAGNVVSGNAGDGIVIAEAGTSGTLVQGNRVGTTATGTEPLGNGGSGLGIFGGAQGNTVGGTVAAARNVISGNGAGIILADSGTNLNLVQGNHIGVNITGAVALGNAGVGVGLFGGAQSNAIGGSVPGAGNVISGNASDGVYFGDSGTHSNVLAGNFIGVNAAGNAALANRNGVALFGGAHDNTIGGVTPGARNVISGNSGTFAGHGIVIGSDGTNGNQIMGNTIGWNAAGSAALPNSGTGVVMFDSVESNSVGGTAPGAANLIAGNGEYGVGLFGFDAELVRNPILGNAIFGNTYGGIALFDGANNNQLPPTLSLATFGTPGNPGGTEVRGSLPVVPGTSFRVEFFASPAGAGAGPGRFLAGSGMVPTIAGNPNFTVNLTAALPAGYFLTATATDPADNTSAFSNAQLITSPDGDGDGIPDAWTQLYFGHAAGQPGDRSLAGDDADGDGQSNFNELRAGTHPRNSASRLTLTIERLGADARLTLPTVLGKTYRYESTGSLLPAAWRLLGDQVPGTTGVLQLTVPAALTLPAGFYRASVVP